MPCKYTYFLDFNTELPSLIMTMSIEKEEFPICREFKTRHGNVVSLHNTHLSSLFGTD